MMPFAFKEALTEGEQVKGAFDGHGQVTWSVKRQQGFQGAFNVICDFVPFNRL